MQEKLTLSISLVNSILYAITKIISYRLLHKTEICSIQNNTISRRVQQSSACFTDYLEAHAKLTKTVKCRFATVFKTQPNCNFHREFDRENGRFSLRMTSPLGRNAFLCCKNLGKSVEAIHNISPTIIFKYVATRTDPLVNTLVDIMHELLCIRDRQLWFSSVDFDVCDADDFINCIARSLYL
jgi:hypothetical protein